MNGYGNECSTSLLLTVFTQRNFVAGKAAVLHFCAPFEDLVATYDDHLRLIGKRVVDFLLVIIELFC